MNKLQRNVILLVATTSFTLRMPTFANEILPKVNFMLVVYM
ncbi:hypothetical protein [Candidatus Epulonipiscium viviparus]|nr:hypothetical protein [Candidatus Epulopiscium viviparus]